MQDQYCISFQQRGMLCAQSQHEGRGGALVETMTFNRRVVGSTPALAAT